MPGFLIGGIASLAGQLIGGIFNAASQAEVAQKNAVYFNFLANQIEQSKPLVQAQADFQNGLVGQNQALANQNLNIQVNQVEADQLTAMAANGLSPQSGSAQQLLTDTYNKQQADALAIKHAADQQLLANNINLISKKADMQNQIDAYRAKAKNAQSVGDINMTSTLLGTAVNVGTNALDMGRSGMFNVPNVPSDSSSDGGGYYGRSSSALVGSPALQTSYNGTYGPSPTPVQPYSFGYDNLDHGPQFNLGLQNYFNN